MKPGYVYILTNQGNHVLYIGVTGNLMQRIRQYREGKGSIFASRYRLRKLVYYETLPTMPEALAVEKKLKNWRRAWKLDLIHARNPGWRDLYEEIIS